MAFSMLVLEPIRAALPDRTLRFVTSFAVMFPALMLLQRWVRPKRR